MASPSTPAMSGKEATTAAAPDEDPGTLERIPLATGRHADDGTAAGASAADSRDDSTSGLARFTDLNGLTDSPEPPHANGAAAGAIALNGASQPELMASQQGQQRRRPLVAKAAVPEATKAAATEGTPGLVAAQHPVKGGRCRLFASIQDLLETTTHRRRSSLSTASTCRNVLLVYVAGVEIAALPAKSVGKAARRGLPGLSRKQNGSSSGGKGFGAQRAGSVPITVEMTRSHWYDLAPSSGAQHQYII